MYSYCLSSNLMSTFSENFSDQTLLRQSIICCNFRHLPFRTFSQFNIFLSYPVKLKGSSLILFATLFGFQIFRIGEIVSLAKGNYTALAIKGGVIGIRWPSWTSLKKNIIEASQFSCHGLVRIGQLFEFLRDYLTKNYIGKYKRKHPYWWLRSTLSDHVKVSCSHAIDQPLFCSHNFSALWALSMLSPCHFAKLPMCQVQRNPTD